MHSVLSFRFFQWLRPARTEPQYVSITPWQLYQVTFLFRRDELTSVKFRGMGMLTFQPSAVPRPGLALKPAFDLVPGGVVGVLSAGDT